MTAGVLRNSTKKGSTMNTKKLLIGTTLLAVTLAGNPTLFFAKGGKIGGKEVTLFIDYATATMLFGDKLPASKPKVIKNMIIDSDDLHGVSLKKPDTLKQILQSGTMDEMSIASPATPKTAVFMISNRTAIDMALVEDELIDETPFVLALGPGALDFIEMFGHDATQTEITDSGIETFFALVGLDIVEPGAVETMSHGDGQHAGREPVFA